ncbi:MAG TPA: ABC transporter substrate-binding protein [Acidimicrobiales bacterium]|nr:ABC transporter substrate-binding protein [Acidimicrobiales bacterium]
MRKHFRINHRGLAVGAMLTAGTLALTGAGFAPIASASRTSHPAKANKSPYVFHAVLSLTGTASFLGAGEKNSLYMLARYVNKTGGIQGHPMTVDVQDNQSNPALAVSIATPWVQSGVPFILDGSAVPYDKPVDALSGANGPVTFDLSPGVHPVPDSYVFSTGISTRFDAQAYLNFFRAKGLTRIAAITSTDGSGADGWAQLQSTLSTPAYAGFTLTTHQSFDPTAVDVTTQMAAIKATNPQAIIEWTTGTPFGTVLKAQSQLGMSSIPTITTDGNADYVEMKSFNSIRPTTLYFPTAAFYQPPNSNLLSPPLKKVVTAFDKMVKGAGGYADDAWGLAYAPALMFVDALRHLGVNATAPQIRHFLNSLKNYPDVYGIYNMTNPAHLTAPPSAATINPNRGLGTHDVYMTQWNGSRFVLVPGFRAGGRKI